MEIRYFCERALTVTFTNGVTGGNTGGGDDSVVTDDPDIVFENLFSTSDANYSVGRLSSSGSVNTSYTGGFVSGFIPAVHGDTIRAKSTNTAFASNYPIIAFYDSSKTCKGALYANSTSQITLSNDSMEFTCDTGVLGSAYQTMTQVRVMGYGSPDGFIITKNEEIK